MSKIREGLTRGGKTTVCPFVVDGFAPACVTGNGGAGCAVASVN